MVRTLAICLAVAAASSSAAYAQEAAPPSDGDTRPDAAASDPDAGEVVVVAQRRTERLRDVPIAITAIDGQSLRETGATALNDITQRTPSLRFNPVPGTPNFAIRGVGTISFDSSLEPAVGLAVDDVIVAYPRYMDLASLADIERIEVLRGPQGILFGKNTTAGLISLVSKRPQLGVTSLTGRVQAANQQQVQAYNILNVPIGGDAALRVRASYLHQASPLRVRGGGTIEDTRAYTFNAKLLWNLTDRLSAYLIADYQNYAGDGGSWTIRSFGSGTNAPAAGNTFIRTTLTGLGIVPGTKNRDTGINGYSFRKSHTTSLQGTLTYDLGSSAITSVTAYRDINQPGSNGDVDSTPTQVLDTNSATANGHQFTQELRIASTGKQFVDWTAGLYYYETKVYSDNLQAGTLGFIPASLPVRLSTSSGLFSNVIRSKSYAAFGQATVNVTDRFSLIAGARYTRDRLNLTTATTPVPGVCGLVFVFTGGRTCLAALPTPIDRTTRDGGWSLRGGAQYKLTSTANVYATYSRGYKGPGVSIASGQAFDVLPEFAESFELGAKADLLDRKVSVNLALFSTKFRDFQVQIYDPTVAPSGAFRTGNAGKLKTRGVEVEAVVRPVSGLSLSGGVTYLDAHYDDFFPQCYPTQTAAQGCLANGTFDASGFRLTGAPKWVNTAAITYSAPLGDALKLTLNADYLRRGAAIFGVGNPNTIQPAYSVVNGTVGIGTFDDRVKVSVFARNLFDKRFASQIFPTFFDTGGYSQIFTDNAFRRVGVALDWSF